jgi:hypothetical protein
VPAPRCEQVDNPAIGPVTVLSGADDFVLMMFGVCIGLCERWLAAPLGRLVAGGAPVTSRPSVEVDGSDGLRGAMHVVR